MSKEKTKSSLEVVNRKAEFQFEFIEMFQAGIMLQGTEIKSIRSGHVNLNDAYCLFVKGELFVKSMYIKEYKFGTYDNHEPRRDRKLLLKRQELRKLQRKVKERGFTIIPYRLFLSERGFAKLEIALARGKRTYDKRQSIKAKDQKRDLERMKKFSM